MPNDILSPSAFFGNESLWDRADRKTREGLVRQLVQARCLRAEHLPGAIFSDPAWDMLLYLLVAHLGRRQLSEAALFSMCGLTPAAGGRWLIELDVQRLIQRSQGGVGGAQPCVELSEQGRVSLNAYFRNMLQ